MPDPRTLAISSVKKIASSGDAILGTLEKTMTALERRLLRDFGDMTLTQQVNVALAREAVENVLVQEGLYERMGALLGEEYQAALEESYRLYREMYPKSFQQFTPDSLSRLEVLRDLDLTAMGSVTQGLADDLTAAVIKYQYGVASREALLAAISDGVGTTANQLKTQFNTSLFGYYQEANNQAAADAGLDRFVYVGPEDSLTRDFCAEVLFDPRNEEGFTEEEILALDNDQGLPVLQYGGGYNCRHTWVAIG